MYKSLHNKKSIPKKNHRNPVSWWDADCDKIKRLRRAAFKKWKYTLNSEDLINYNKLVAQAKKLYKKKKKNDFQKFAGTINFKTNLKYTWNKGKIFKNKWIKINPTSVHENLQNREKVLKELDNLYPPWFPSNSSHFLIHLYHSLNLT